MHGRGCKAEAIPQYAEDKSDQPRLPLPATRAAEQALAEGEADKRKQEIRDIDAGNQRLRHAINGLRKGGQHEQPASLRVQRRGGYIANISPGQSIDQ